LDIVVLLFVEAGWAHAQANSVASAVPIRMGNGFECGVIEDKS
jgi:hypothetical protein